MKDNKNKKNCNLFIHLFIYLFHFFILKFYKKKIFCLIYNFFYFFIYLFIFHLIFFFLHYCLLSPKRKTDGQNIYRIDAHLWGKSAQKEIGAISQLGAEKITIPPKPDRRTDLRTDISNYRVASLLKKDKSSNYYQIINF